MSPRGLYWALARLNMRIGGLVSEGVALGHRTGFDSGSTLDYVYRNEPRGAGPVGRFIDRNYLESIGWRGIRQRKLNVEELLRRGMRLLRDKQMPVRVMDIAAGHGRYVLEALDGADVKPDAILLRDYSDINVEAGAKLIAQKGLDGTARFVKGDAFDRDEPRGCGAEADARRGLRSLRAVPRQCHGPRLARRAGRGGPAGGYLVYTCQPWHPQLELIARALTSHRQGQAWIMRRRTQGEMDQLVEAAGFRKLEQRIDEFGIFTVSLAERMAP